MVESAIVLSAFLTILLGAIQFGVVGFLQLTVDAGSFLNAHQNVIGTKDPSVADATHQVFPQIQVGDIAAPVVAPAPSPHVYVDYGYNSSNAAVQAASSTNRHGGASLLQPYKLQSTITKQPFTILGHQLSVQSTATEAKWYETGPHWDINNLQYGGDSPATTYRADPYVDGTNTPPYFMARGEVLHCPAVQVDWVSCPVTQDIIALGLGNNLDIFNWSNPKPGVSGPANSVGSGGTTGTFQTMACHQRYYAQLAQLFQANPSLAALEQTYSIAAVNQKANVMNFKTWAAYPNDTSSLAGQAKHAIQTIYSWDVEQGYQPPLNFQFGLNPLFPTRNC